MECTELLPTGEVGRGSYKSSFTPMNQEIEKAMTGGIVFKGRKERPKEEPKIKTKAKKKTYITGLHGSGAAKMKAEIRRKRANRHKQ